jgi:hypothetical protein
MRLLLIVIVIIVIAAMFQASRKGCYWHGDPIAWTSCLLRLGPIALLKPFWGRHNSEGQYWDEISMLVRSGVIVAEAMAGRRATFINVASRGQGQLGARGLRATAFRGPVVVGGRVVAGRLAGSRLI